MHLSLVHLQPWVQACIHLSRSRPKHVHLPPFGKKRIKKQKCSSLSPLPFFLHCTVITGASWVHIYKFFIEQLMDCTWRKSAHFGHNYSGTRYSMVSYGSLFLFLSLSAWVYSIKISINIPEVLSYSTVEHRLVIEQSKAIEVQETTLHRTTLSLTIISMWCHNVKQIYLCYITFKIRYFPNRKHKLLVPHPQSGPYIPTSGLVVIMSKGICPCPIPTIQSCRM